MLHRAICNLSFLSVISLYFFFLGVLHCSLDDYIQLILSDCIFLGELSYGLHLMHTDRQVTCFVSCEWLYLRQRHSNGQPLWSLIWISFPPPCPQDDAWSKLMKLILHLTNCNCLSVFVFFTLSKSFICNDTFKILEGENTWWYQPKITTDWNDTDTICNIIHFVMMQFDMFYVCLRYVLNENYW